MVKKMTCMRRTPTERDTMLKNGTQSYRDIRANAMNA